MRRRFAFDRVQRNCLGGRLVEASAIHKRTADIVAGVVALIVLIAGTTLVLVSSGVSAPKTTTTVAKSAVARVPSASRTVVVTRERGRGTRVVTRQSAPIAPQPRKVTTTTTANDRTFIERMLGDEGLGFIKLAIVVLAAFLSGALVQRAILGQYGVTVGGFGLPQLQETADTSAVAIEKLSRSLQAQRTALEELSRDLHDRARETRGDLAAVSDDLAVVYHRLSVAERALARRARASRSRRSR